MEDENNWKRELNSKGYFVIKNLFNNQFVEETKSKITTTNVQVDMLNCVLFYKKV